MTEILDDIEYILDFDPTDSSVMVGLVKDLVAMANSGGGQIQFGWDEAGRPGIDPSTAKHLDPARLAETVGRFTRAGVLEISQNIEALKNGRQIVTITVTGAPYPLLMSRAGTWRGFDDSKDRPMFKEGEIWVRRRGKTERATQEDLVTWVEGARQAEREKIMARLAAYVNLPEGSTLQVVTPSGAAIGSPMRLLENARRRRLRDPDHLLSYDDLLWIFRQRDSLRLKEADITILLASSLRRNATLFWWLAQVGEHRDLVMGELFAVFEASDRDKSDAASSIVELAALIASEEELAALIGQLKTSRYKHFREAGEHWQGREAELANLAGRIRSARHDGRRLVDYVPADLEQLATFLAAQLSERRSAALSRKLGNVTRALWAKSTGAGRTLLNESGATQLGLPGTG